MSGKCIDITGQKFNKLLVLERAPNQGDYVMWRCSCDCGTEKVIRSDAIRYGLTRSCGCLNQEADLSERLGMNQFIDIAGQRFGRLTVLERASTISHGNTRFHCRCDCGNITITTSSALRSGKSKSCGCYQREVVRALATKLPLGEAAFNQIFSSYRTRAKRRGISFGLTKETFRELTMQNCFYCGSPPNAVRRSSMTNGKYIYNGLDRLASDMGYTADNVVPACAFCNFAKQRASVDNFRQWIIQVHKHFIEERN